jgi:predicted neuraminidase
MSSLPAWPLLACLLLPASGVAAAAELRSELIFPLRGEHNHAPGIVECPNGDLLASWYRGSGERQADDVAVFGARLRKGESTWSEAFLLADTPGFPDGNTVLWIDAKERLWLFWPLVIANTWESCLTHYRVAREYQGDGAPRWEWQGIVPLKPVDFEKTMLEALEARLAKTEQPAPEGAAPERIEAYKKRIADRLAQRLGWQTRCKPAVLPSGRILLPLYSDTYSVSLMAISDDGGASWFASRPLAGFGNIQPAVLRRQDGTLVAYMRENGPMDRIRVAESRDDGITWGPVGAIDLANPGAGIDGLRLASGRWALVYNDTARGRHSLALSLSDDEGRTWKWTRHLERQPGGSFHYPAMVQGRDGTIHVVYSYFVAGGKSMKHAAFSEDWGLAGDSASTGGAPAAFEDRFAAGKLAEGWFWEREDSAAWRLGDGELAIRIQPGNNWGPAASARNTLLRRLPAAGAATLAAEVEVATDAFDQQYEQAGIVWWDDAANQVKLVKERIDGKLWAVLGREEADRGSLVGRKELPAGAGAVGLRLILGGGRLKGQWRGAPDAAWEDVGECELPSRGPGEPKVSLQAYNGPSDSEHWARFRSFRIAPRD